MPSSSACSTCESGTAPVVWKIRVRKAGLRPTTTSGPPSPSAGLALGRQRHAPPLLGRPASPARSGPPRATGRCAWPVIWDRRRRRQAVTGAGAGVAVGVVDRADHLAAFDPWRPSADSRRRPAAAPSRRGWRPRHAKPRAARARITSTMVRPRSRTASFMTPSSPRLKVCGVVRAVGVDDREQLPLAGLGQLQLLEHGRHGGDGALAHGHQLILGHMAQAALDQIVALQGEIVLGVLGVEQGGVERVVVARDRPHAGADQIGAGHQDTA